MLKGLFLTNGKKKNENTTKQNPSSIQSHNVGEGNVNNIKNNNFIVRKMMKSAWSHTYFIPLHMANDLTESLLVNSCFSPSLLRYTL